MNSPLLRSNSMACSCWRVVTCQGSEMVRREESYAVDFADANGRQSPRAIMAGTVRHISLLTFTGQR